MSKAKVVEVKYYREGVVESTATVEMVLSTYGVEDIVNLLTEDPEKATEDGWKIYLIEADGEEVWSELKRFKNE